MTGFRACECRAGRRLPLGLVGGPARVGLLALLLAVLASSEAAAAGYFLPVNGVRPLGRAGAVTASGAGPHSIWFNPAMLAGMTETHLLADIALSDLQTSFLRTPRLEPNGDVTVYQAVSNDQGPAMVPNLIATTDFGIDRLALALGLIAPYGGLYTYPVDGPQRYSAIQNSESFYFRIALGAAYEVTDWFRVGASFQNLYFRSTVVVMASAYQGPFGQPEDPDLDILMKVDSVDPFTPTGNLGVWFRLIEGLELAVAVQLPARIEDNDATLQVRLPTNPFFDGGRVEGDTVSGGFDLAATIRAGVRWVHDRGDVEANVMWENWSVHEAIETTPRELVIVGLFAIDEFAIGPLTVEMDWQNAWGVSLGSDYEVIRDRLILRGGLVYEQSAIPDERLSLFQPDLDKIAPTLGLSLELPEYGLTFDAGYAHFFFLDRDVTNSAVQQINPKFEEGAIIVGNGHYEGNLDIFGLGVEAQF